MENMDGKSLDVAQEKISRLKGIFPEAVTDGKLDWDRLRQALGENLAGGQERYGLSWPGKSEVFRTIQEPTTATLVPAREESIDFDATENVFIEGENLETLKVLQKAYFGKVKVIIIDEPYNTGNDSFIYPDNFTERTDRRREAIANLKPCCTLRYLATHKNLYNLLYSLNPVTAYDLGLVKQIGVTSVISRDDNNAAYVGLEGFSPGKKSISAKISLFVDERNGVVKKT